MANRIIPTMFGRVRTGGMAMTKRHEKETKRHDKETLHVISRNVHR